MNKALIVVDIQNDFCPGGTLAVDGGDEIIDPVNRLINFFYENDVPVFYTRDWHPPNHISFTQNGGTWPIHCVKDTKGSQFHKNLIILPDSDIISKATNENEEAYSGFQGTELHSLLTKLNIEDLYIVGLATDYCVKNTVIDALKLGYETVVILEGIKAVNINPNDGEESLNEMSNLGAEIVSISDIIK